MRAGRAGSWVVVLALLLVVGCTHDYDSLTGQGGGGAGACSPGAETCTCAAGSTCQPGLTCASDRCVNLSGKGGTAGGTGGTIAGTGGAGTGGTVTATGGTSAMVGTGGAQMGSGGTGAGGSGTGTGGTSAMVGTGGAQMGSGGTGAGGSGTGGKGTGGSGTGGAGTGGSGTGGAGTGTGGTSGTGGAGTGGSGTGGTSGGTDPCAGLCTSPITVPPKSNSGDLGTTASCRAVAGGTITGLTCGNFVAPRTFTVNGTSLDCVTGGTFQLPAERNGGYCMQAGAGDYAYAFFTTY